MRLVRSFRNTGPVQCPDEVSAGRVSQLSSEGVLNQLRDTDGAVEDGSWIVPAADEYPTALVGFRFTLAADADAFH